MTHSFQAGDDGGGRPSRPSDIGTGAPEKARYPSDPVYDRTATSRGGGSTPSGADLGEAARTATDALKRQAAQFAEGVGHELGKTGESQKARGVDALRRVARAIDTAADELKDQSPLVARTVHEAARQVDGIGDTLANRNVNDLMDQAVRFARSQPALFIGGTVVAGFALARFLMSSGRHGTTVSGGPRSDPYPRSDSYRPTDPYQP